jgi:hypothetical protein
MSPRVRKLIGSAAVLAFMTVYIWGASALSAWVPDNQFAKLLYFAAAGIAWGFPLFPLITWMQRAPDKR